MAEFMKSGSKKTQALIQLLIFAGILIFINIIANSTIGNKRLYSFWDLTQEKRFTLSDGSKNVMDNVDDVLYIKVLLDGELPAGFKRLQSSLMDLLLDLKNEAPYLEYSIDNPVTGSTEQINARIKELAEKNVRPTRLKEKNSDGSTSEKIIFPYAQIFYKGAEIPVNLLENEVPGVPKEVILNNSVSLLEYKIVSAIHQMERKRKPIVAFSTGHGELTPIEVADLEQSLQQFYETTSVEMDSLVALSESLDLLIIAKPQAPFSEKELFKVDQYIMNGGKVLWLIDAVNVSLDSLQGTKQYFPQPYNTQLDGALFKYGVRIDQNIVLDMQCSRIPLAVGQSGDAPQLEYFPYPYHLVVPSASNHPIVNGVGPVNLLYASSIDTTIQTKYGVEKTVLLSSSKYSRYQRLPLGMDFEFLRYDLIPEKFDKGPQVLSLLLEGTFSSAYANRVSSEMMAALDEIGLPFKDKSVDNKMIIVSDGDIAKNSVNMREGKYNPLGYNEFERYRFANKDFLMNAIEYLLDTQGVITARGKDVQLRLLDVQKIQEEKTKWQVLNIGLPILALALFGFIFNWFRKRRYS